MYRTIQFLTIVLCVLAIFSRRLNSNEDNIPISLNRLGWEVPKISAYEQLSRTEFLDEEKQKFFIESYRVKNNLTIWETMGSRVTNIGLNRAINSVAKVEESDYLLEKWNSFQIVKNEEDRIVYIKKGFILISFNNVLDIKDRYSIIKKIFAIPNLIIKESPREDAFIFDRDCDGIFESLIINQNQNYSDQMILKEIKKLQGEQFKSDGFVRVKRDIINFINFPNKQNAQKMYESIPTLELYKDNSMNKVQINNEIWDFENKLEKKQLDTPQINFSTEIVNSEDRFDFWLWLSQNIDKIKDEAYCGELYAIKTLFKLYPIFASIQGKEQINLQFLPEEDSEIQYCKIDQIFDSLIRIQPRSFLTEFQNHLKLVRIQDILDGNFGLEMIGKADLKYLQTLKKIEALKSVTDESLTEIKNLCVRFLEKEKEFLEKNFDIEKKRFLTTDVLRYPFPS